MTGLKIRTILILAISLFSLIIFLKTISPNDAVHGRILQNAGWDMHAVSQVGDRSVFWGGNIRPEQGGQYDPCDPNNDGCEDRCCKSGQTCNPPIIYNNDPSCIAPPTSIPINTPNPTAPLGPTSTTRPGPTHGVVVNPQCVDTLGGKFCPTPRYTESPTPTSTLRYTPPSNTPDPPACGRNSADEFCVVSQFEAAEGMVIRVLVSDFPIEASACSDWELGAPFYLQRAGTAVGSCAAHPGLRERPDRVLFASCPLAYISYVRFLDHVDQIGDEHGIDYADDILDTLRLQPELACPLANAIANGEGLPAGFAIGIPDAIRVASVFACYPAIDVEAGAQIANSLIDANVDPSALLLDGNASRVNTCGVVWHMALLGGLHDEEMRAYEALRSDACIGESGLAMDLLLDQIVTNRSILENYQDRTGNPFPSTCEIPSLNPPTCIASDAIAVSEIVRIPQIDYVAILDGHEVFADDVLQLVDHPGLADYRCGMPEGRPVIPSVTDDTLIEVIGVFEADQIIYTIVGVSPTPLGREGFTPGIYPDVDQIEGSGDLGLAFMRPSDQEGRVEELLFSLEEPNSTFGPPRLFTLPDSYRLARHPVSPAPEITEGLFVNPNLFVTLLDVNDDPFVYRLGIDGSSEFVTQGHSPAYDEFETSGLLAVVQDDRIAIGSPTEFGAGRTLYEIGASTYDGTDGVCHSLSFGPHGEVMFVCNPEDSEPTLQNLHLYWGKVCEFSVIADDDQVMGLEIISPRIVTSEYMFFIADGNLYSGHFQVEECNIQNETVELLVSDVGEFPPGITHFDVVSLTE